MVSSVNPSLLCVCVRCCDTWYAELNKNLWILCSSVDCVYPTLPLQPETSCKRFQQTPGSPLPAPLPAAQVLLYWNSSQSNYAENKYMPQRGDNLNRILPLLTFFLLFFSSFFCSLLFLSFIRLSAYSHPKLRNKCLVCPDVSNRFFFCCWAGSCGRR